MEIIDDPVIQRDVQQRDAGHAVIAYAADDQPAARNDRPHQTDPLSSNLIPGIRHFLQNDFIERFKRHLILVISKPVRDPAPQIHETLLKVFVIEELLPVHILLQRVK